MILSLFRGITLPVLPYLPRVPRANAQGIAHPQTASAARPCLGLLGYHLSEVRASEPTLTVTRCGVEVARRLAIFVATTFTIHLLLPTFYLLPFTFFYYPGLRPPVAGGVRFSSSLGRVKASFSLHSFFRQIYIEGELFPRSFVSAARTTGWFTSRIFVVLLPPRSQR